MISQEVQTLSCLLKNRTGLIGKLPESRPQKVAFVLEDGTQLRLLGFNHCHPSIVTGLGQRKTACFGKGRGRKKISLKEWENLLESANAVLFTKIGREYEVEILGRNRVTSTITLRGVVTILFKKTGKTDWFIPT